MNTNKSMVQTQKTKECRPVPKIHKTRTIYDSLSEEEDAKKHYYNLIPSTFSKSYKIYLIFRFIFFFLLLCNSVVFYYWISFYPTPNYSRSSYENQLENYLLVIDLAVILEFMLSLTLAYDLDDKLIFKPQSLLSAIFRENIFLDMMNSIPFFIIYSKVFKPTVFNSDLHSKVILGGSK
jgi:hypothetical protein